jgi:PAS domain S-box-containing protein
MPDFKNIIFIIKDPELLKQVLALEKQLFCQPVIFNNGQDGLDYLDNEKINTCSIFIEHAFPEIDGISILEILHTRLAPKKYLLYFISEVDSSKLASRLFKKGISDYILKSDFTLQLLTEILNSTDEIFNNSLEYNRSLDKFSNFLLPKFLNYGECCFSENGKIIYINEKAAALFGGSIDDYKDQVIYNLSALNDALLIGGRIFKASNENKVCKYEDLIVFPHGSYWLESYYFPYSDLNQNFRCIRLFLNDITELKEPQKKIAQLHIELTEKNKLYKVLLDVFPFIIYSYDLQEERYILKNNGPEKFLGYNENDLKVFGNQFFENVMFAEDFNNHIQNIIPKYSIAKDGDVIKDKFRMLHRDGSCKWFESQEMITKRLPDGIPCQITGILSDISETVKIHEALNTSNFRLEQALGIGNIAWWDWNVKTGKIDFHPRKTELLGYAPNEIEPNVYAFTSMLHPDDYEPTMQAMRDHLANRNPVYEVEYRIKTKHGEWKWFYDRGIVSSFDENNKPDRLI